MSSAAQAEHDPASDPEQPTALLSLDEAIGIALSDSTMISEAASKYSAAVEEKRSALADFLPKLSTSYSYTRFDDQPYMVFDNMKIPFMTTDFIIGISRLSSPFLPVTPCIPGIRWQNSISI